MPQPRTWIFLPPLPTLSGGLQVLINLANTLHGAGFPLSAVLREAAPWQHALAMKPVLMHTLQQPHDLKPNDIWLVPEGWPAALLPGLKAGLRTVIYAQNWAYVLADLPQNLHLGQLPVEFLAASAPVAWYVEQVTGKKAQILRPALADFFFSPPNADPVPQNPRIAESPRIESPGIAESPRIAASLRIAESPRIAWMPRKNKAMGRQIMEMVTARRQRLGLPAVEWVSIHKMKPEEVAATLRTCDLFLSTGFPEGLGLPPLEAMACGCLGVGFSGFGGLDYMRLWQAEPQTEPQAEPQAGPQVLPPAFAQMPGNAFAQNSPPAPNLPFFTPAPLAAYLPQNVPANGFWVSDGDCVGAALAVDEALLVLNQPGALAQLKAAGRASAALYQPTLFHDRVVELWQHFSPKD